MLTKNDTIQSSGPPSSFSAMDEHEVKI